MYKKINYGIVLCAFITFVSICHAQVPNSDTEAKSILAKVSAKYKTLKTIQADFLQNIENPHAKTNDHLKGTLYIKGNNFKLEMNNQVVICDNKTIWTYNTTQNEVQVNNYEPSPSDINPANVFNIYEKGFLYAFNSEKQEGGKTIDYIDLTPTDKGKPYFKVRMAVDKSTSTISSAVFMFKDGKKYTFSILNFKPNAPINDNMFSFDAKAHPGVEVTDLR